MEVYSEFIKKSTLEIEEKLSFFTDEKKQGKRYQDIIVRLFMGAKIVVSNSCKLQESKKTDIIKDILKDLPLIDNELYNFLSKLREYYKSMQYKKQTNHPAATQSKEEYIKSIVGQSKYDILSLHEKKQYDSDYDNYRKQQDKSYKTWNETLYRDLLNNQNIQEFVRKRVSDYNQEESNRLKKNIEDISIDSKTINQLLHRSNITQQEKDILMRELGVLEAQYQYENTQLKILEEQSYLIEKESIFKHKLINLLKHYILSSSEHANENVRKKYIEIFLYDNIGKGIEISQDKEYKLVLPKHAQTIENETNNILLQILEKYKKEDNKKVMMHKNKLIKKRQLSLFEGDY